MEVCCSVTEDKMGAKTEAAKVEAEVVCSQGVPELQDVNSVVQEKELVPRIRSGSFADIGPRRCMEDEHLRMDDLSMHLELECDLRCPKPSAFYVIFDGHGGSEASAYLKENAMRFIFKDAEFPESSEVDEVFLDSVEKSLHKAFILADIALADDDSISPWSGTTALAALIFGRVLMVANAGDCRAVLCRKGEAIDMSRDHKAVCPSEKRRVEEMGGFVDNGYLNGILAVTRALGDWEMKMGLPSPLIPDPEIQRIVLTREDEFLIVACDGIWDVMSSQHAVDIVRGSLRRHNKLDACARELAMEALRLETFDNLTVIVVCLTNRNHVQEAPPPQQQQQQRWRPRFRCSEAVLYPTNFPSGNDSC